MTEQNANLAITELQGVKVISSEPKYDMVDKDDIIMDQDIDTMEKIEMHEYCGCASIRVEGKEIIVEIQTWYQSKLWLFIHLHH